MHLPATSQFDHIIIGLLPSVPAAWLIALAIPGMVLRKRNAGREMPRSSEPALQVLPWMIGLAAVVQFVYVIVFFYGAERYTADFYPCLVVLIALLTWKMDEKLRHRPWLRLAMWLAVVGLIAWSAGIGFFGGFGIPPRLFRTSNLDLYAQLGGYWDDRYATLQAVLKKVQTWLSG